MMKRGDATAIFCVICVHLPAAAAPMHMQPPPHMYGMPPSGVCARNVSVWKSGAPDGQRTPHGCDAAFGDASQASHACASGRDRVSAS